MNKIRILICDDHALFRAGIISILKEEQNIFICGEAADGQELLKQYELLKPDMLLVDISMPVMNGTEAVKKLKQKYPDIKVLFLSMLQGEEYIYLILKCGGMGLINKNIAKGELFYAISEINFGRNYFGPGYNENRLQEIVRKFDALPLKPEIYNYDDINETEAQILNMISEGFSSSEIADQICLSKRTVDSYRIKIMQKYDIKNSSGLIKFAIIFNNSKKS